MSNQCPSPKRRNQTNTQSNSSDTLTQPERHRCSPRCIKPQTQTVAQGVSVSTGGWHHTGSAAPRSPGVGRRYISGAGPWAAHLPNLLLTPLNLQDSTQEGTMKTIIALVVLCFAAAYVSPRFSYAFLFLTKSLVFEMNNEKDNRA